MAQSVPASPVDCVVVGGGIAGLVAAHALSGRRVLVLEAADRPGGRVYSMPAAPYWLNFGAHMFGGPGTVIGDLARELGLPLRPIDGSLMGMAYRGARVLPGRLEALPFRLPLGLADRLDFIRMGLRLRRGSQELLPLLEEPHVDQAVRRARIQAFGDDRTFAAYIGRRRPEIARLLVALTERTGGDPAEMSAGHALRSFSNVWTRHSPGNNLVGGSAGLPRALAEKLGGRLLLGARVTTVDGTAGGVVVDYRQDGTDHRVTARTAIVATPAPTTRRIVTHLPPPTAAALDKIRYGAFLSAAVLTRETAAMPWDRNYAISSPGLSFSVLFNQATTLRGGGDRQPGGSLMLFRGARGASDLLAHNDSTIRDRFLTDLLRVFPEGTGLVGEIVIQRWELGAPFGWPGRAHLQPALDAPLPRIALAGDYLDFPNMETAAQTGLEAAGRIRSLLDEANPARSDAD